MKCPTSPSDMFSRVARLKASRMWSIFLIWAEVKGKACGPDHRVTTLKSCCGRQPVERRRCHRDTDSLSSAACCVCVSSCPSVLVLHGCFALTGHEGGTLALRYQVDSSVLCVLVSWWDTVHIPAWRPWRHWSTPAWLQKCPVCQMRKSRFINRSSCKEKAYMAVCFESVPHKSSCCCKYLPEHHMCIHPWLEIVPNKCTVSFCWNNVWWRPQYTAFFGTIWSLFLKNELDFNVPSSRFLAFDANQWLWSTLLGSLNVFRERQTQRWFVELVASRNKCRIMSAL